MPLTFNVDSTSQARAKGDVAVDPCNYTNLCVRRPRLPTNLQRYTFISVLIIETPRSEDREQRKCCSDSTIGDEGRTEHSGIFLDLQTRRH